MSMTTPKRPRHPTQKVQNSSLFHGDFVGSSGLTSGGQSLAFPWRDIRCPLRGTLQTQLFNALQQTRIECKPKGHRIEMPVAKHGHNSMFGPAVDLCRESRPARPWDTHEPMLQVRRAAVESNHIGHLSTNLFIQYFSPQRRYTANDEDARNSRHLADSLVDNTVSLLQPPATSTFPGWRQRVGPLLAAFAEVDHHRPNRRVERYLLRETLM